MNKIFGIVLLMLIPSASAELRINANLEYNHTFIELTPENCRIVGQVTYDRPGAPGSNVILTIENIICGDSIFSDGFDGTN